MNWKPIVAGVDGTPESVRAAVAGGVIAQRAGTTCRLVAAAAGRGDADGAFRATLATSLQGYVPQSLIDNLAIRRGSEPIVLREAALRAGAGAIVVGHRRHLDRSWLQPSLVSHLLRSCDVPVLIATGGFPVFQRVLVGLDRASPEPVFEAALQWADLFGAQLRAVVGVERYPAISLAVEAEAWKADLLVVGSRGVAQLLHRPPTMTLVVPVNLPAAERAPDAGRPAWRARAEALALA